CGVSEAGVRGGGKNVGRNRGIGVRRGRADGTHASPDRREGARRRRAREFLLDPPRETTSSSRCDAPEAAILRLRPVRPSAATSLRAARRRLFHRTRYRELTAIPHRAPRTVVAARRLPRPAPALGELERPRMSRLRCEGAVGGKQTEPQRQLQLDFAAVADRALL